MALCSRCSTHSPWERFTRHVSQLWYDTPPKQMSLSERWVCGGKERGRRGRGTIAVVIATCRWTGWRCRGLSRRLWLNFGMLLVYLWHITRNVNAFAFLFSLSSSHTTYPVQRQLTGIKVFWSVHEGTLYAHIHVHRFVGMLTETPTCNLTVSFLKKYGFCSNT